MKQEENAILMLNVFRSDTNLPQMVIDNYNLAIGAIEKQMPKKPSRNEYCPECGAHIKGNPGEEMYSWDDYCVECGQKLDWRKE